MPGSGTRTFLEPDDYEASLRQTQIELVSTCCGGFEARLTWAELHSMQLLRCEETLPRIVYLCLAPQLVFIAFPASSGPMPVWRGTKMQAGDIMFHSRGERLHQAATLGPSIWSLLALDSVRLNDYGRTLFGRPLSLPAEGRVLRPSPRDAARLRRLHAQACRLAETKPELRDLKTRVESLRHFFGLIDGLAVRLLSLETEELSDLGMLLGVDQAAAEAIDPEALKQ